MKKLLSCAAAVVALSGMAAAPAYAARDYVWAAGSSTVFPFSTRVAENYAKKTGKKAPKVESLGTGGGIKLFCSGAGEGFPDIANASRPMKKAEFDACAAKGVKDIVQIKIGFDGIVIATDKDGADYNFKTEQLFLGLAANVYKNGQWVKNTTNSWDDVGGGLPGNKIQVYGPPPTSGTRDAFVELAIEAGARKFPSIDAIRSDNEKLFKSKVDPLRSDGWIDAGENDNAIVGDPDQDPGRAGRVRPDLLRREHGQGEGRASVNGVRPSAQTISDGSYPLSRSLYIYVKKANLGVTPGLQDFVNEFVSDAATGRGGYLQGRGLIPLPPGAHEGQKAVAKAGTPMGRPAS